jgi:hypothetical protein
MLPLFIYIIKTILVSGILLGYYWIGLRNTRFHYYNRFYLVGTVLFSLFLPLLDLQWFTFTPPAAQPVQQVVQYIYNAQSTSQVQTAFSSEQLLAIGLFLVSAILVSFLLIGIVKVFLIKYRGKITVMEKFDFIETALDEAPFSFFRNLFWRKNLPLNDETGQRMLKHELTHIEQHHSFDKLFISLVTYIFWMNPFNWLIRKELEVVHEFIADEEAISGGDVGILAEMLLKAHYHSTILSVGQSFFYSSIKRRIIMLTSSKKVSYSYARRILILPIAIGILALLSFTIKDSLSDAQNKELDQSAIVLNKLDTVPGKYRDPQTGKIKGSFQIDIDGDMATFKDIKSKKELFKVPLSEISGPANKVLRVEGFPLDKSEKVMFISGDSTSKSEFIFISDGNAMSPMPPLSSMPSILVDEVGKQAIPTIIINGKVVSPDEIGKIDPSGIRTIDVRGNERGISIDGKKMKGMTWVESTTNDGKKIVTVKMDTIIFKANGSVDQAKVNATTAVPVESNVYIKVIKGDSTEVKTVVGQKLNETPKTVVVTTTDDNAASVFLKDPKTLTVTVNEADGDKKKTYTIIQKQTAKTELTNDLLYIIDGKEMQSGSMKDIDPTTIKAIHVLKGDAAVKKYGEKAKNGVVEITTKK